MLFSLHNGVSEAPRDPSREEKRMWTETTSARAEDLAVRTRETENGRPIREKNNKIKVPVFFGDARQRWNRSYPFLIHHSGPTRGVLRYYLAFNEAGGWLSHRMLFPVEERVKSS